MGDSETYRRKGSPMLTFVLCFALTVLCIVEVLLITYSKNDEGGYDYDKTTSVMLSEMCKFLISGSVLLHRMRRQGPDEPPLTSPLTRSSFRYAVPAVLYAFHNCIIFIALELLTPSSYQLFSNLKVVTTAIVFRLFMKRPLRLLQWLAIVLLLLGMCVSQLSDGSGPVGDDNTQRLGKVWEGFCWMVVLSICSALAGVYNEHLLKNGKQDSLMWKNMQLYFFSSLSCAAPAIWASLTTSASTEDDASNKSMFDGFGSSAWAIVLMNGVIGQVISLIFLYADIIVKVYATCVAVLVTPILANQLFGTEVSFPLATGILITIISTLLYFLKEDLLNTNDDVLIGIACTKGGRTEYDKKSKQALLSTRSIPDVAR